MNDAETKMSMSDEFRARAFATILYVSAFVSSVWTAGWVRGHSMSIPGIALTAFAARTVGAFVLSAYIDAKSDARGRIASSNRPDQKPV